MAHRAGRAVAVVEVIVAAAGQQLEALGDGHMVEEIGRGDQRPRVAGRGLPGQQEHRSACGLDRRQQVDPRQRADVEREVVAAARQLEPAEQLVGDRAGRGGGARLDLVAPELLAVVEQHQRAGDLQAAGRIGEDAVEQGAVGEPGKLAVVRLVVQGEGAGLALPVELEAAEPLVRAVEGRLIGPAGGDVGHPVAQQRQPGIGVEMVLEALEAHDQ